MGRVLRRDGVCLVLLLLAAGLLGTAGCRSPKSRWVPARQPQPAAPTKPGQVLARVGDSVVAVKNALTRRRAADPKGKVPAQRFAEQLVEEQLLVNDAWSKGLNRHPAIRRAVRRAAVRRLLADFRRKHGPAAVDRLRALKHYNDYKHVHWKRPRMAGALHLLSFVEFKWPKGVTLDKGVLPPHLVAPYNARRVNGLWLVLKFLALLERQPPATSVEFNAVARAFAKGTARQERCIALLGPRLLALLAGGRPPGPALKRRSRVLLDRYSDRSRACGQLSAAVASAVLAKRSWTSVQWGKALLSLRKMIRGSMASRQVPVVVQALPPFPERYFAGWSYMLPRFSKAAFALKLGEHSARPVQTMHGFHVIYRFATLHPVDLPFTRVEADIRRKLSRKARPKAFRDLIYILRRRYKVQTHPKRLGKVRRR